MSNTASLKKEYAERIAPALKNQFQYTSSMQIPVLKKIVINQGLGTFCILFLSWRCFRALEWRPALL